MRRRALPAALALAGAALAAASAYRLGATAWPEIVTPAWFVTRGLVLYDAIFFPHTPLLILLTAALGGAFGFSAAVLRAVPALALGACGALVVLGTRPGRASGAAAGLLAGVPALVLLTVYAEGPALWPEPFLAPVLVGGVLLLERFALSRGGRALVAAGLLFGLALLVKQTSSWAALGALGWLLARRASGRDLLRFGAAVAAPYAAFVVVWAAAFRTLAHVRWTLVLPLLEGHAREIATRPGGADLLEAVWLFLPFAATALLARAVGPARFRSPAAFVALAAAGMAWPRWGLLHLAATTGLGALAASRACLLAAAAIRSARRRRRPVLQAIAAAAGVAVLATFLAVGIAGAGSLAAGQVGFPLYYWDDTHTRAALRVVKARVAPGSALLVFTERQTLYPLAGAVAPGGFYVNPSFWYYLNKDGIDARLVAALRASPGLPILFREPSVDAGPIGATATYAFVTRETRREGAAGDAEWRVVPAQGR